MTKQLIAVTQESEDGCTGVVGVFTNSDRARDVRNRLNAKNDGYKYDLNFTNEDPSDAEVFED